MVDVTPQEIDRTTALLEALVEDRTRLSVVAKEQRNALLIAAGRLSRPERDEVQRMSKAFRRISRKQDQAADAAARAGTGIRAARRAEVYTPPPQLRTGDAPPAGPAVEPHRPAELLKARACYACKASFARLHFFYDSMCETCAQLNYEKRFQTARLEGRVALITGARVKIGYQAALMMLRAGARVIVTTRFPHDAAQRYAREADFAAWSDRLEVHGLDLRHCPSVELFARYLEQTQPKLDFLVNNAAQTVRRPTGFYAHLLPFELRPTADLPDDVRSVLSAHEACTGTLLGGKSPGRPPALASSDGAASPRGRELDATGLSVWQDGAPGIGLRSAALLSQMPCTYDDGVGHADLFPTGRLDADEQQVDLRTMNSWRMALGDVPTPELLEVNLVNAVAPFILCSKLKPLMMRGRDEAKGDRHIVNVSAMEGIFSRHTKTDKHPHTNMAKAALNMMTLTSAPDYAKSGIFMNAVDTGWVTDEDPIALSLRKQKDHDFQPPLDVVDGAARVCDPFFTGLNTGIHVYGKFLKDYRPAPW
jgi:NAD(P)-dependent dehydrogenase (short-subunit alcohol dehydrogenase family)